MLVVLVSCCVHRAWKRTRLVADAYLERIGERTWRGRLTAEGLEKLREELSAAASRHTAVAASVVRGRRRFELEWIVGSGRPFGPDGQCVTYEGHAYDRFFTSVPEPSPGWRSLEAVLELAGLWHDTGKANEEFQDKLRRNQHSADTVRHEILSNRFLVATLRHLGQDWRRATAEQVMQAMRVALDRPFTFSANDQTCDLAPPDLDFPLRLVAWLVATHHRLPEADYPADGQSLADAGLFTLSDHTNRDKLVRPEQISLDPRLITPELAADSAAALRRLTAVQTAGLAGPGWGTASVVGRLGLILADRLISRQSHDADWHQGHGPFPDALLANWQGGGGEARQPRQSLDEHLRKVGPYAAMALSDMLDLRQMALSLPCAGLPRALRGRSPAAFAWQDRAVEVVRAGRMAQAGFFAEVLAGTGTGKTRACVKILAAAGESLRYTLCLPLRSLTLQAGSDYRTDLGLNHADVATVIGSQAVADLYERRDEKCGSESAVGPLGLLMDDPAWSGGERRKDHSRIRLPDGLWKHVQGDAQAARFLAAPIVVSTIDQMMDVADARRTSYLTAALRLLSADLVLDEIDSYDAGDQVAIGRLVFLAGLLGRKVVIASATLTQPHASGLFRAYYQGYQEYCRFSGCPVQIDVGLFADGGEQARLFQASGTEHYQRESGEFRQAISRHLAQQPVIRRAAILPRLSGIGAVRRRQMTRRPAREDESADQTDACFRQIAGGLTSLHQTRHSPDARTGKRVSVLLVRFAHIRSCVAFARWLAGTSEVLPAGIDFRIQLYHSRFPLLMRDRIETFMDQALKRKTAAKDNFLHHPLIRNWLKQSPATDIMLVVVTTSVEEIGRDHDFDGLVAEPSSEQSIIQCAGRVDRHRRRPCDDTTPNILILPTSMRVIRGEKPDFPYTAPGPEGTWKALCRQYRLPSLWIDELTTFRQPHSPVDAACRLYAGDQPSVLNELEHRILSDFMLHPAPYALAGFTDLSAHFWLAASHAKKMPFRQTTRPTVQVWLDPVTGCFMSDYSGAGSQSVNETIQYCPDISLQGRALLDLSPETILAEEYAAERVDSANPADVRKFSRHFLQLSLPEGSYRYSPDLGAFRSA